MSIGLLMGFGAIGVMARYLISSSFPALGFPWATLLVNILGSFLAGVVYSYQNQMGGPLSPVVYTALLVGLLGGLTTYSSFSLDTMRLLQSQAYAMAGLNILLNNFLSLLFCFLGLRLVSLFAES